MTPVAKRPLALLLCLAVLAGVSSPASASQAGQGGGAPRLLVSVKLVELVQGAPAGVSAAESIRYWVEGNKAQTVSVDLVDLIVLEDGTRSILPPGTTDHSLEGIVSWSKIEQDYVPNGARQPFSLDVKADSSPVESIHYGGVRISIRDPQGAPSGGGLTGVYSIVTTVLVIPDGWEGGIPFSLRPELATSDLQIARFGEASWIDRLIPDIPGVVTRGPVAASLSATNTSDTPGYVSTTWTFSRGEEVLLRQSGAPRLLLPRQRVEESSVSATDVAGSDRMANVLPSFGWVNVSTQVRGTLAGTTFDETDVNAGFLVVGWKEPFLLALVLFLFWLIRRRRIAKAALPASAGVQASVPESTASGPASPR